MSEAIPQAAIERLVNDLELAEQRAEILRALGNPVRLRLVARLCFSQERTVGELCDELGLAQSTVSRQLGALRLLGLVRCRQDGGFRYYSLALPQVVSLIECLAPCRPDLPHL